jgi:phospholipid transport system substrate-binding protein
MSGYYNLGFKELGMSQVVRFVGALALSVVSFFAWSQEVVEPTLSAHQVVQATTTEVMAVIDAAQEYVDESPELYYLAVHKVLDPIIDFRGFARSVMGPYASSDQYRSLDESGRQQLRVQLERFTEVMRLGLVTTYSKGLLAFAGSAIELEAPEPDAEVESRVSVRQIIHNDTPEPYVVMYQMGLNKAKQWKLRNVIIENVNLGEIYKTQFEASARKHDGDLDAVISNWSSVEVES